MRSHSQSVVILLYTGSYGLYVWAYGGQMGSYGFVYVFARDHCMSLFGFILTYILLCHMVCMLSIWFYMVGPPWPQIIVCAKLYAYTNRYTYTHVLSRSLPYSAPCPPRMLWMKVWMSKWWHSNKCGQTAEVTKILFRQQDALSLISDAHGWMNEIHIFLLFNEITDKVTCLG